MISRLLLTALMGALLFALPPTDWSLVGTAGEEFGMAVASAGDVQGDGFEDVLVGGPFYQKRGRAYLYSGSPAGLGPGPAWTAEGDQANAAFGYMVGSGDFNCDGYSDAVIGAPYYSLGQSQEGTVFVWYGSAAGLGPNGTPANADWRAESNLSQGTLMAPRFGQTLASGDFNGDGCADLLVGSERHSFENHAEGAAFVWFGSPSGLGPNGTPTNADWRAEGNQENAWLGSSVASAGDVNGDGFDEVLVGGFHYSKGQELEGAAFVWYGSALGLGPNGHLENADWIAETDQSFAGMGYWRQSVSGGDLNGDGFSDVALGAPFYQRHQIGEGAVFVFLGSPQGLNQNNTPSWIGYGLVEQARFGTTVAILSDLTGDGRDELGVYIVDFNPADPLNPGRLVIYLGGPGGPSPTRIVINGNQLDDFFGQSLAAANVNGGPADLIVGQPGMDVANLKNSGRAVAFYGPLTTALNEDEAASSFHLYLPVVW